jgi:hypothetical protein
MTAEEWIAVGTGVLATATVAMAAAVIVTAFIALRTLKATHQDSRARTRPVIVAELRRELLAHGTMLLVVKNLGASVARNVAVEFDPAPPADVDSLLDSDMLKWLYQRYATPVSTWAPGWTLSNVVRVGQEPLAPMTVTVTYEGPDGSPYSDKYDLHPDHILKETSSAPSKTTDPVKLEQHKLEALQALVRTMRAS